MSDNVTYAAHGYWLRALEINQVLYQRDQGSLAMVEHGMDLCTGLEFMTGPEWLKPHAKLFAANRYAALVRLYETLIEKYDQYA